MPVLEPLLRTYYTEVLVYYYYCWFTLAVLPGIIHCSMRSSIDAIYRPLVGLLLKFIYVLKSTTMVVRHTHARLQKQCDSVLEAGILLILIT